MEQPKLDLYQLTKDVYCHFDNIVRHSDLDTIDKVRMSKAIVRASKEESPFIAEVINSLIRRAVCEWIESNHKLTALWREIAVQNASHSDHPHKVASETIEAYKKEFNIE